VHLPGKDAPDWSAFRSKSIQIIESGRHHRKLRRGALAFNSFDIVVRNLTTVDLQLFENRLQSISLLGVPNYFGPQRFGYQENNITKAENLFQKTFKAPDRYHRGLYLSAARAYVFNQLLSERVRLNNWNRAIPGDVLVLEGSRAFFKPETIDRKILQRIQTMDIHPSGVLWGNGKQVVSDLALAIEEKIVEHNPTMCRGLESFGLEIGRRSLRLKVTKLQWKYIDKSSLELEFKLFPGSYATSVLRELIQFT